MNTQIATNKRLLPQARRKAIRPRQLSVIVGLAVAGLSSAVNAATSFPDYPLQTHAGSVPPNIMFILDNSGSMTNAFMGSGVSRDGIQFVNTSNEPVRFQDTAVYFNAIGYDPNKKYEAWTNADGTKMTGGTSVDAVYTNSQLASGATLNLNNRNESHFYAYKGSGNPRYRGNYWRFRLGADGRWWRAEYRDSSTVANRIWHNEVAVDPPGVSDQYTNFATWYSYHRTRLKVAKAGASKAFYGLEGDNYRVGYDVIAGTAYGNPQVPIPVTSDSGLFRGSNRTLWFNRLIAQTTSGGTPLRTALHRAGNYFETNGAAWTVNGTGEEYSCRRSYAILTTDGFWNDISGGYSSPFPVDIGNVDGTSSPNYSAVRPYADGHANTLADVAMHFWKRDLRPAVANDISPTPNNPATWQHMVTFGVSIGLQGTIAPTAGNLAQISSGSLDWPSPLLAENATRIDDLWHAAVNSRGEFVAASDAEAFAKALTDALDAITAENGSGGGIGATGRVIVSDSRVYQGSYQSGTWLGDVKAFALGADGTASGAALWSFAQNSKIPAMNFAGRKVYTSKGGGATGNGTAGEFVSSFMPSTVLTQLARTSGVAPVSAADNIDYIKGVQSKEKAQGGLLRDRATLVGDIVNSVPTHLPANNSIYVGANDGMLHGISAVDGKPLFSYMPKGINYAALAEISNPNYKHRFFVDGEIAISDATTGSGKNILISALGRGGKGLFALNVTTPASFSAGNVLWDRTGEGDGDIGYILGKPMILRSNAGNTVVLAPNGIESSNGRAVVLVYVLDASGKPTTGSPLKLGQTAGAGNGMMSLVAADIDQNGTVDYVYGGDIQGNVWKIDMASNEASDWKVAHETAGGAVAPMFSARDADDQPQPITGGLSVAREPGTGRLFVSFGTGKFMADSDKVSATGAAPQTQTLYGIIDEGGTTPVARGNLTRRTFPNSGVYAGRIARSLEEYSDLPPSSKGWYLDLGEPASMQGERIITAPEVFGRVLAVASLVPRVATGCTPETEGNLIAMDAFTGTLPKVDGATSGYFDIDGDGEADKVGDEYIGSISTGIGTGGVKFFRKPDGNVAVIMGTYTGGQLSFNILLRSRLNARLNWRELVAND